MSATDYDANFYDLIAGGCEVSAAVVAPIIHEMHPATTVVDVGCGQGWWGQAFEQLGCAVSGIDGGYVPDRKIATFVEHDLNEPLPDVGTFDLAVCLEVAEHLPESRAAGFVADLCALAPTVLFSAATPHQSGAGHVNCRWPSWWARLFADHGYHLDGSIRWLIWNDERVEPWYRQNLLVASRDSVETQPLDVIHPVIHEWGR